MNKLERLYQFFKKFDANLLLDIILIDGETQLFIINAIKYRITTYGLTASLKELTTNNAFREIKKGRARTYGGIKKVYGGSTNRIKRKKTGISGKFSNVTLYDTGSFYDSFRILTTKTSFKIIADTEKENGDISDNFTFLFNQKEFYKEILALSEQEKKQLNDEIIRPYMIDLIRKSLKSI